MRRTRSRERNGNINIGGLIVESKLNLDIHKNPNRPSPTNPHAHAILIGITKKTKLNSFGALSSTGYPATQLTSHQAFASVWQT